MTFLARTCVELLFLSLPRSSNFHRSYLNKQREFSMFLKDLILYFYDDRITYSRFAEFYYNVISTLHFGLSNNALVLRARAQ